MWGFLSDRKFNRELMRLALPSAVQNLMLALVAAADALMLGGVSQDAMASVSLATQIQFVQNCILMVMTAAASILGAQYWGKKDRASVGDVFCLSLRACGAVSVLFFVGCVFFPRALMRIFAHDAGLVALGVDYLRVAGWSYLLTGVSQCYLNLMRFTDRVAGSARISAWTVVLNIVLNAVFIFGLCGFPALGIRGAAYATLVARATELVWCLAASARKDGFRPDLRGLLRIHPDLDRDFIRCLLPLLGAGLLWGVGFTSYTAFMGHLGPDAAAANAVAAVIRDLVCCLCNGLSVGGGILVGNALGAGRLDLGRLYGDRTTAIAFLCGAASALLMFLSTPIVLRFVKLSEGASGLLLGMMVIMAVYMVGRAVNTIVINGIFAAGGDTAFDLYSLAVTMWGLAVPLAALGTFRFHWPVLVVYACTCLDEVGKIPWVMVHYRRYKWVKDLTRERKA